MGATPGVTTGTMSAGSPATSRARSAVAEEETTTKELLEMQTQTSLLELDLKFLISHATILNDPAMATWTRVVAVCLTTSTLLSILTMTLISRNCHPNLKSSPLDQTTTLPFSNPNSSQYQWWWIQQLSSNTVNIKTITVLTFLQQFFSCHAAWLVSKLSIYLSLIYDTSD